jgi:NADPH:quinone reductase-like Zn-dependent oxidoreductase
MPAVATTKATMKAIRIHRFGGPEVLQLEDVPVPRPASEQVLVRVFAAGVNPVDWKIREGRLGQFPLPAIIGTDFSGEVEALGPAAEQFRVGEHVFGVVADESGSYAEFAVAPVSEIAPIPSGLSHAEAAALPIASLTAWQALFDKAQLKPGQRVLIHAAAGGVGSFAVQFAKWKRAYVLGTASAEHAAFVRQLGANEVIDYRATRFEGVARDVDVVLDTIGGQTQERSWKVLKKGGVLVSIVQPPDPGLAAAFGVQGAFLICDHKRPDELAQIAEFVSKGEIDVFVSTVLPLSEARKAQEFCRGAIHPDGARCNSSQLFGRRCRGKN